MLTGGQALYNITPPPFYDICSLLSPEDQAQAQEPEELANHSWLMQVQGGRPGSEIPAISTLPVC